jgi:hypothetical protein
MWRLAGLKRLGRRSGLVAVALGSGLLLVGLVALVALRTHATGMIGMPSSSVAPPSTPGSQAAFHYLAGQHSNFCSLTADTVMSMPDSSRLQGACCSAMDMVTYRAQVSTLPKYADDAIPTDPYDMPVPLAKRLINYDRSIHLSPGQKAVFDAAMTRTEDKAPCCCQCWRWYAHQGLAQHLIVDRGWDATAVGAVINLVNGCGGQRTVALAVLDPPDG